MARTSSGERLASVRESERRPRFRRATRRDAVDLAFDIFESEARVDLQALAAELAVSTATLHRWFGSRAGLLDQVFERLTIGFVASARAEAQGEGDELVCDVARRIMETSVVSGPILAFVKREPQLALRIVLGKEGAVHRVLAETLRLVLAETRPPDAAQELDSQVDAIVQLGTSLQWATLTIGDEPQIDSVVEIIGKLLAVAHQSS